MQFWKGHALGNDYIVLDRTGSGPPEATLVRALCDRHRGVGGDGVLVADRGTDPVSLRIFNPDGSEAEKSGNGLRIFGAWLHQQGLVGSDAPFEVALPAERVEMRVEPPAEPRPRPGRPGRPGLEGAGVGADARAGAGQDPALEGGSRMLRVGMGQARFRAGDIPFAGVDPDAEVQGHPLELDGERFEIHLVSLGNPHCVVFVDDLDVEDFRRRAPRLQADAAFERGVNVQFARSIAPNVLEAFVWERGAGETLASGSSACAVAATARRAGLVTGNRFEVRMPGGALTVEIEEDWVVRLTGEARIVFGGELLPGWT